MVETLVDSYQERTRVPKEYKYGGYLSFWGICRPGVIVSRVNVVRGYCRAGLLSLGVIAAGWLSPG